MNKNTNHRNNNKNRNVNRQNMIDFDIAYNNYLQGFVDLINKSNMPLTVTADILRGLLEQTQVALQNKMQQYQESINKNVNNQNVQSEQKTNIKTDNTVKTDNALDK